MAAMALQSLGFCPAQLEGSATDCLCQQLLEWELLGSAHCQERSPGVLTFGTSSCREACGTEGQSLRGGVKLGQPKFEEDACLLCLYSLCTVSLSR